MHLRLFQWSRLATYFYRQTIVGLILLSQSFSLFPASNIDQVDALTMAINYCLQRTAPQITEVQWGRSARHLQMSNHLIYGDKLSGMEQGDG